jgi:hypothetical protein
VAHFGVRRREFLTRSRAKLVHRFELLGKRRLTVTSVAPMTHAKCVRRVGCTYPSTPLHVESTAARSREMDFPEKDNLWGSFAQFEWNHDCPRVYRLITALACFAG